MTASWPLWAAREAAGRLAKFTSAVDPAPGTSTLTFPGLLICAGFKLNFAQKSLNFVLFKVCPVASLAPLPSVWNKAGQALLGMVLAC